MDSKNKSAIIGIAICISSLLFLESFYKAIGFVLGFLFALFGQLKENNIPESNKDNIIDAEVVDEE